MAQESDDWSKIYEAGQTLAAKDKTTEEYAAAYQTVLEGRHGSEKSKQLAAQLIPRFFARFPAISEESINGQLDMCEDTNVNVRVNAIRGLTEFFRQVPANTQRIAEILTQLLLSENPLELNSVKRGFNMAFSQDAKACFAALFAQIADSESDDTLRQKAGEFLIVQLSPAQGGEETAVTKVAADPALQKFVVDSIKKHLSLGLLEAASADLSRILTGMGGAASAQEMVTLLASKLKLEDKSTDPRSEGFCSKFQHALSQILPVLPKGLTTTHHTDIGTGYGMEAHSLSLDSAALTLRNPSR